MQGQADANRGIAWLVIGSSPSVIRTLPIARSKCDKVITCNSGIKLCPVPSVYLAVDHLSSRELYPHLAREAQKRGTHLVTLRRELSALKWRDVDWYDEFIVPSPHGPPTREQYGHFRYSGPLCVEYACHNGASEVHLVGMDGYRGVNDYFDKDTPRFSRPNMYQTHTIDHIRPRMREIARVWHDVQFVLWGDPCYEVDSPNWRVIRDGVDSSS